MQYLESFYNYLQYERRNSLHTVIAYKNDLDQFCKFLECDNIELWINVTSKTVRSWIVSLVEEGASPRTVTRKISTLKVFFRFLMVQEVVDNNVAEFVITPKMPKRLPVFVKEEEMDFLLDCVEFGHDFKGLRDRLIIEIFYHTGMRLSELVNLNDKNIDFGNGVFKILGKRNKERIVPIIKELKESLVRYINERNKVFSERANSSLLLTEKGFPVYHKLVYRVVNSYLSQVSTVVKKSPHVIRHTFATALLNRGADLNAIKELLGHSNLAATEVYTHNTFEKLNSIYKQAHPRAEKDGGLYMNITIQSVRFTASAQLEEFVQQKVGKLDQFFDGIVSAEVILRLEKSDSTENKVAEINLNIPGDKLFAKKQCKTFEEGVDLSVDALRKQLIKWKEKVRAK